MIVVLQYMRFSLIPSETTLEIFHLAYQYKIEKNISQLMELSILIQINVFNNSALKAT